MPVNITFVDTLIFGFSPCIISFILLNQSLACSFAFSIILSICLGVTSPVRLAYSDLEGATTT
jgi:hypothetical protein